MFIRQCLGGFCGDTLGIPETEHPPPRPTPAVTTPAKSTLPTAGRKTGLPTAVYPLGSLLWLQLC